MKRNCSVNLDQVYYIMSKRNYQIREAKEYKISEGDFLGQVIDLAHVYGWKVAHFRPAQTKYGWRTPVQADGKGFPDLVMLKPPRLVFAELKSEKGKLSPEQEGWLSLLKGIKGIEVYCWKPKDFESIVDILT